MPTFKNARNVAVPAALFATAALTACGSTPTGGPVAASTPPSATATPSPLQLTAPEHAKPFRPETPTTRNAGRGTTQDTAPTRSPVTVKQGAPARSGANATRVPATRSASPAGRAKSSAEVTTRTRAQHATTPRQQGGGVRVAGGGARSNIAPIVASLRQGAGSLTGLSIPSIGLSHSIVPISPRGGVAAPPPGVVGAMPSPGSSQMTAVLGHVTEYGPDVFYNLKNLRPGQNVIFRYSNGGTRTFTVSTAYSIDKDALRLDQRVWGRTPAGPIALITCDSSSRWENAQHHANNYVVLLRAS